MAASPHEPERSWPPLPEEETAALTRRDMLAFVAAAAIAQDAEGRNIKGFNDLIRHGLPHILGEHFRLSRVSQNERTQTPEDREISHFTEEVQFTDIRVGRPVGTHYRTGLQAPVYPAMVRNTNVPYGGQLTLGARVTLTAHRHDGRTEARQAELPPFQVGEVPVMVGSVVCHTAAETREGLKALGEDPTDGGGYFLSGGAEVVVDSLENICYNSPHVYREMRAGENARCEFLSQPGGAYENSSMIRLRYRKNGQLTVEINSIKFGRVNGSGVSLPFFVVFRLFGMMSDREVAAAIVGDPAGANAAPMREIVARAFGLADPAFAPLVAERDVSRVVLHTAERLVTYLANPGAYGSNESAVQFLASDLLGSPDRPGGLDRILLPHMGLTAAARIPKLRFLGLLFHRVLLVHLGVLPESDRDSYVNKRIHGPDVSLAKMFKTQFNNSVVTALMRGLRRLEKAEPFAGVTPARLVEVVRGAVATGDLSRALDQAITAGNTVVVIGRRAAVNRVSAQALERKNPLNCKSAKLSIVSPQSGQTAKQTQRADLQRRVHPSFLGFVCVSQSADTGPNVGMRKQACVTTGVTLAADALPLRRLLLADPAVVPLEALADPARAPRTKVFLNGEWLGATRDAHGLAARYRGLRREGRGVPPHATVAWDLITDQVSFWLDVGRIYRPLLIVDSNLAEHDAACRARFAWEAGGRAGPEPAAVPFRQNLRFTPRHARELRAGRLSVADLVAAGVAEYVTPEEQANCVVAPWVGELLARRGDVTARFTHCDVEQAIFGLAALVSPYANHTQPARVTYETNQGRQTGGWYALNFPERLDKGRFFQWQNEKPVVGTLTEVATLPNGFHVSIAYCPYGGDNQEDSAIINRAAAERGLFWGSLFRYELAELEKGEHFCTPDPATSRPKPNACYEKLVDGFVRPGSVVYYGDVLIGRVAKNPRARAGDPDSLPFVDRSVLYRSHEPAFVVRVEQPRGANDELFGVVVLRFERPVRTGDKLCMLADHDVLTARGWVPVAGVTLEDSVATIRKDGSLGYDRPTATHAFEVDEDLYEIDAQQVSLATTLNHRMYVKRRGRATFELAEAASIVGKRVSYKRNAENILPDAETFTCPGADGTDDLVLPMDAWLKILGAFIADGWVDKRNLSYTSIAMTKARKIAFLREALECTGLRHWHHADKYHIDSPQVRRALEPLSVGAVSKFLPDYVWQLSQRQARVLLAALVQGDGHVSKTCTMYYTSSNRLADDVQRLALHAGWSGNKAMHMPRGTSATFADGRVATATEDGWRVGIIMAKNEPTVNHGHIKAQARQTERIFPYKGMVYCLSMPEETFYVRRNGVTVWTGNSSRSGNKSIIARLLPQCDMPYAEDGTTPDIIMNTHSIPSRMTLGQLIETEMGNICAKRGTTTDGTAFMEVDHEAKAAALYALGFRENSRRTLYNGLTGEYQDFAIFTGFILEQRLQKFVLDDEQAVTGSGPTDATTGQPLGGKHVQGGLRLGEMELWALYAQGSVLNAYEKTSTDSDGRVMHVCRGCCTPGVFNEFQGLAQCRTCGQCADFAAVDTTKSANLFREELAAANIVLRLGLAPRAFAAALSAADPPRGALGAGEARGWAGAEAWGGGAPSGGPAPRAAADPWGAGADAAWEGAAAWP